MTRSLGDHSAEKVGVISDPTVTLKVFASDTIAILVATDGLFEFTEPAKLSKIVMAH